MIVAPTCGRGSFCCYLVINWTSVSGRRIKKNVVGSYVVKYVYDGGHVIAEYDDSNLLRKYIYGARVDEPVCMIDVADSNAVYYYHYDGLDSVVALSDSAGDSISKQVFTITVPGIITDVPPAVFS